MNSIKVRRAFLVDYLKLYRRQALSSPQHMVGAANWLAAAQDLTPDGGVSALFSLRSGWDLSYPETTGYIIPTLFSYAHWTGQAAWGERAMRMADWLLMKQMEAGCWPGRSDPGAPLVFDTGQVIFGLVRAYLETQASKYLESAVKAARWLVSIQESDGAWLKYAYQGVRHAYHTRVAWALLEVYLETLDKEFQKAAERNLSWVLQHQHADGWFEHAGFNVHQPPSLHTIAYTIRGLLESGVMLNDARFTQAAVRAADVLLKAQRKDGALPGEFNPGWHSTVGWSCLTGSAQTAVIWLRLYQLGGVDSYYSAARQANTFIKQTQNLDARDPGIRGGVKGSHPINGGYAAYVYPNWAAKFFLDSLLLEENIAAGLDQPMKRSGGGEVQDCV